MTRLYRALLHLYPASFRCEYGDELTAVFAQRATERGRFIATAEAVADVLPSAVAAHADILRQDLRYTVRAMSRAPGFVATAVLVVALGVGANTAAFTLADFVLLRPLPFPEPDRLVKIWETTPGYSRMEASAANYRDWKTLTSSFSGMGAYTDYAVNLVSTTDAPRRITTAMVTFDLMPMLGVNAALGRAIAPADSFGEPVIVLSHALWQSQFAGDPGILGRHVRLDGVSSVVIGVMPQTFHFPTRDIEAWTPLVLGPQQFLDRGDNWLQVLARLRPGTSLERGAADVSLAMTQLVRKFPKELENTGVATIRLREETSARSRVMVLALCGAALCILLLACANLASLLLARAINRERELAVRAALGAGRERIVRQLVTESVALALLGGLAGLLVAKTVLPALSFLVPESLPIGEQPLIDPRVLAFAALIIAVTGLAFGVVPAVRAGGAKTFDGLREGARAGGGRKQRLRAALVAVEIAMSVVLLASSVAMAAAGRALEQRDTRALVRRLLLAGGLGAAFLLVQGYEWIRLVSYGLTAWSGAYGTTFYTVIGTHAAHVVAAVVWVAVTAWLAASGRFVDGRTGTLRACAIYWHFVVALWPVLYVAVYLL
jgi:putative ABC transport system permease protein